MITDSIHPVAGHEAGEGRQDRRFGEHHALSLAERLALGTTRAAVCFGGQGAPCLDELAVLERESPGVRAWVDAATGALVELLGRREFRWSGLYERGLDVSRWVRDEARRPETAYLASSAVSQPLIFITQIATWQALFDEGLAAAVTAGAIPVATGHSQGMMAALVVAESPGGAVRLPRFVDVVRYFAWQGLHMAQSFGGRVRGEGAPMAAISGPTLDELRRTLEGVHRARGQSDPVVALHNTRTRHVVSGTAPSLAALRAALEAREAAEGRLRKEGRLGGRPLRVTWEDLAVGAAFHSPHMQAGLDAMRESVRALGFAAGPLHLDVISPATGERLNDSPDLVEELLVSQFVRPVRWPATVEGLRGVDHVLDLGPGEGVARLTRSLLRGSGVRVHAVALPSERSALFRPAEEAPALRYADLAPRRVEDPTPRLENRYTRATGRPPVILAGMTPTTADAGIVAAAANAGFTAELAGGGQVTERIFRLRLEELAERLEPGREVVFNALYLDPWLWDLHVRRAGLVLEARRAGAPICGVTISAGVPDVDEAVALLETFAAAGLWQNGFKPGTVAQVEQVVRIARAAPSHTLFLHLEGGKAGGHHSFEDLDQLLLDTYHMIREQQNLVLCAGGGIGSEGRAADLLTGEWATRYGLRPMPVDAVLIGTLAMACAEAATSPQVKAALVAASGTAAWVLRGQVEGGVTSGRSQLDADIHYLESSAARCGRLLDEVAGDAAAVRARRAEIVDALSRTSRPYFGDVADMTWLAALERMVALMALGRFGRYEDGPWLDRTWRERVADMLRRGEARLGVGGESVLGSLDALDEPQRVLERFAERYPEARTRRVHPADADWFVHSVCARPGKPVPFVPVIDEGVRRWFKADSLWASHDARFDADQVLVIPGPEAVAGILRADEPIGELLERFVAALEGRCEVGEALEAQWPSSVLVEQDARGVTLRGMHEDASWLPVIGARFRGVLSALLRAPRVFEGRRSVPNPLWELCVCEAGASLRVDANGDTATSLRYHPARPYQGEEVHVVVEGEGARLTARCGDADLVLALTHVGGAFHMAPEERAEAVRRFYDAALVGAPVEPVGLFEEAVGEGVVEPGRVQGYAALTAAPVGEPPLSLAFSLGWEPLLRVLACPDACPDMLRLVHLDNEVERGGWPVAGQGARIAARVTRVEDTAKGRVISTLAEDGAVVRSRFFVRGDFGRTPWTVRAREPFLATLRVEDPGAFEHLREHEGVTLDAAWSWAPCELTLRAELDEERPREGTPRFGARGVLLRGDERVGTIELDVRRDARVHPLRALAQVLGAGDAVVETPRLRLAATEVRAPQDLTAFAECSGDLNPIHRSVLAARLAGLGGPIVHGMWSAARLHSLVVEAVGEARRVTEFAASFMAPALPGEVLRLEAHRTGVRGGALRVELVATALRDPEVPVVRAVAWVAPPRTAYVFPGQGVQRQGMGMEGYGRSAAARAVWDRADAHTRGRLGFSILRVVRDNPKELVVDGSSVVHPEGVLHLTQLTQVAMAVMARAQVEELREAGVLVEDAVAAGHSVGEYNALGAIADVLPVEALVELVYQRGLVMHGLVGRDAAGESGYRMGVVRPHLAGLSQYEVEALVSEVRKGGRFAQIVNYNVRGRQYAVTGHADALAALARALGERTVPGGKPAWVDVPGIDVPFHSELLRAGVGSFREALRRHLPAEVDEQRLVGRYVPDLLPVPFALTREFAEALRELTASEAVVDLLARFDELSPRVLARELLVELLAWQFASPVRWIEVQEALLRPLEQGGLGVERVIEVGPGHQPTLVNMLRSSLGSAAVEVLHAEADLARVLCRDEVDDGSGEAAAEAEAEGPPPTATGGAPVGPPVVAPLASAAPLAPAGGAPVDRPFTAGDALRFILAAQARVRPEQIDERESIDELFDGVSSRRNQVLLDIGAELSLGTMDGAHERPIGELARELERRARYTAPGRYLRAAEDEAIKKVLGRRAGLGRKDIGAWLDQTWGLGAGLTEAVIAALTLEVREGASARGGALGQLAGAAPEGRGAALELLDRVASMVGARLGLPLQRRGEVAGGAVDAGAVQELRNELLGPGGVLMQTARELATRLGGTVAGGVPEPDESAERLALYEGELGAEYAALVTPAFDRRKHVALASCWAWARRDVARLALGPEPSPRELAREAARLAIFGADAGVAATARWYGGRAQGPLADALARIAAGDGAAPYAVTPSRPHLDDAGAPREVPDEREDALARWVEEVTASGHASAEGPGFSLGAALREAIQRPLSLAGTTALVTGASPGSIAVEAVGHLLRGGARVVVTTSTYTRDRLLYYRRLYQRAAGPGAELHVVPFNQASRQDADALVAWLFDPVVEQVGAAAQVTKRPFAPDLVLPFAALKDLATLDTMGARSEAALRAMLVGVERLVGGIAARYGRDGLLSRRCHVVLPLSPNHGSFGGDGAYAEGKAALEVLAARWQSEHDAWGRAMTLCAARIGWVRGTGLMDQNDAVAEALEREAGIRTFSSPEMGLLVAALCTPEARGAALVAPLRADLTGGLGAATGLRELVQGVREGIEAQLGARRRRADLARREAALAGEPAVPPTVVPLPEWLPASRRAPLRWPACAARLDETVVIVGMGEVGPWGSSRTRFEVELNGGLSAAGALELAWVTGLIRYEDHRWVDVESGEEVPEAQIRERYEAEVLGRAGVRLLDPRGAGFDPARLPVLATVYLERDFSFPVGSLDEARSFVDADPEHTRVEQDGGAWRVTRLAGAEVRVPRQVRLSRRVAGAVPDGFDPQRHGIPAEMAGSVDRLSLMNLVATVDAFVSAGLTPEELLRHLHPARVANTQGGGIGGMRSLRRLYLDHLLGQERQSDALQETLINVVAAYVVQSYVGSYGPMAHPVGACATAAISLEEARDKILAGKADFVVAGGYDDIGAEGMVGFADMNATASTDDMLAMGLGPDQMSRANDVRRRGFVEAQGGGTLLLARGDVALALGLPVHGVLAWAGSFGDGIHKSIPAPGMGALAAAMGGADSPLGLALRRFGLTADDVALVSKHDTSTGANDPNESALHHRLQAALGRTPGNPLWVVSQKALTGHAKGGAAAWQAIGLCQALAAGVVPGNRNLESVDPAMRRFTHLGFTDTPLCQPLRAGLLTSLGFGHASGMALVLHPDAFEALVPADERQAYRAAAEARREVERRRVAEALMGSGGYAKRTHRRFAAPDGSDAQAEEEAAMLLNPKARLDPATGLFTVAP